MHQERRATPQQQAAYERRMARRNRRAGGRGRNYLAKLIGYGTAAFFVIMIIVAITGG